MLKSISQHLSEARQILIAADIDGSALDARLLLQAATGLSHAEIIAEPDHEVGKAQAENFKNFLERRLAHEPVSRIIGVREFYGRDFKVTTAVLDPRADTETMIEMVLGLNKSGRILDIGTGSGAIIVTLLAEIPSASGVAVDVSQDALQIAKANALCHGVSGRLNFHQGSWFAGLQEKFDLIVSNPPYIPHAEIGSLEIDVKNYDPHLALDGGGDGLFAYRAIAAGAKAHLFDNGLIIVEIGAGQESDVTKIFELHNFKSLAQRKDLGGHVRCLAFQTC